MKKKSSSGFTLTELIITLAIGLLLITQATPAFTDFIRQTRLITATAALHHALNLARMEAIKRNGKVDLTAHGGNWKNGWVITDNNQLIFKQAALNRDIDISTSFRNKTTLSYNGTGRTSSTQSGTWHLSSGKHSRLVIVNLLGRVRVCNPAAAPKTCVIKTADNLMAEDEQ